MIRVCPTTDLAQQIIHAKAIQIAHNLNLCVEPMSRASKRTALIHRVGFVHSERPSHLLLPLVLRQVEKLRGGVSLLLDHLQKCVCVCVCVYVCDVNAVGELSQEQLTRVRHQELNTSTRTALKLSVIARRATRNEQDLYFNG